jgi:hypothetical protein
MILAFEYITLGDPVTVAFAYVSGYRITTIPEPPKNGPPTG